MEQANYISLIHKKLAGQISPTEQETLKQWLSESIDNRQTMAELEKAWEMTSTYQENYKPNVEAGLVRLKKRIEADQAIVRPIQPKNTRLRVFSRIAAAAVVVGLMAIAWLFYPNGSASTWQTATTDTKQEQKLDLPDGSTIWLNENSSVEFPQRFSNDKREVRLKGEAFFDISKDADRPFIILTEDTEVKVLGTSFNVKAYPAEETTQLTVRTGSVQFKVNATGQDWILAPNDSYLFNRSDMSIKRSKDVNALAWHTKQLVFDNTPIKEVLPQVEQLYEGQIELAQAQLLNCRLTADFDHAPLKEIVETIATTLGMNIVELDKASFRLEGGSCD